MEKISTIQKRNKLNLVYRVDEPGPGGACHSYEVFNKNAADGNEVVITTIQFQKGPRNEEGSTTGVLDTDLLEMVRDRLQAFQKGEFACRENAIALTKIEEALLWLNKRVEDRAERNVLGTSLK